MLIQSKTMPKNFITCSNWTDSLYLAKHCKNVKKKT